MLTPDEYETQWKEWIEKDGLLLKLQNGKSRQKVENLQESLNDFKARYPESQNQDFKKYWEYQVSVAQELLELAKDMVPPLTWDILQESALFFKKRLPKKEWKWDAYCAFCGYPRCVEKKTSVGVVCVHTDEAGDKEAKKGKLILELVYDTGKDASEKYGNGILYPSPSGGNVFIMRDASFDKAIENARKYFYDKLKQKDIRWSLSWQENEFVPSLEGGSLGGAFALGIYKLLCDPDDELDLDGVVITAALDESGKLYEVDQIEQKFEALKSSRLVIVAAEQKIQE